MKFASTIKKIFEERNLLSASGDLAEIDSLDLIDVVIALEEATGINVPTTELSSANFSSLAATNNLFERLSTQAA